MKKLIICATVAMFALGTQAMAQAEEEEKSMADINIESYEKYLAIDKELNQVYKKLTSKLNKKQKETLVKGQKAWIIYRDSDCNLRSAQYEGGSMQPAVENECLFERTNQRVIELKEMLNEF